MSHMLAVRPSGSIYVLVGDSRESSVKAKPHKALERAMTCFAEQETAAALFKLCAIPSDELPTSIRYFREFTGAYLNIRCQNSVEGEAWRELPQAEDDLLKHFLLNTPPIRGAEYVTDTVLRQWWESLDQWLYTQVDGDLAQLYTFLEQEAPDWHPMGRVCFHLAENKEQADYPFAFLATYSPAYQSGKKRHLPLAKALKAYAGAENQAELIHLLSPISLAAKTSAWLKALVDSGEVYQALAWEPHQAYAFLREVPLLQAAGIITLLPDWWRQRPRPKVKAVLDVPTKSHLGADNLLKFQVDMVVGDESLTKTELKHLLEAEQGLMFLKGQWVEIDADKLQATMQQMKALEQEQGISFIDGMRLMAGMPLDSSDPKQDAEQDKAWGFVSAGKKLGPLLEKMRSPESIQQAFPKSQLKATLRPYQEVGVQWLWHLNQLGLGACLADDMGLGKTLQVITLLLFIKKQQARKAERQACLLLVPSSLMGNWEREIQRFAPSLTICFAHSAFNSKQALQDLSEAGTFSDVDLLITSYGMATRQSWLQDHRWHTLILDEAQAIKNPASQQTKAVKKLQANAKVALTGTPIENRLGDLWSLFDFLCPGLLGSSQRFKGYIKSLEKRETHQYAPLRKLVQPYILRRLKTDKRIISDLPDKLETAAFCGLTRHQARLYQHSVKALKNALEENTEGMKRRGLILSYLSRFKQICNHPAQALGDGDYNAKHSGKFLRLAELCEEIQSRQEKVLVFTQYREMCEPLADFLAECFQQSGLILHGATATKKRQKLVDNFQQEQGPPFFVISLKAGGTGLNLTAANHVIHFDRWWNPAVENQATDRAFRIGQEKHVVVHKFVCQGTIEEKIDAMIQDKAQLSQQLLSDSDDEVNLTEMDDAALMQMVSLDIERASL